MTEIEYVEHGTTMRNEAITKKNDFHLSIYFKQPRGFIELVNYLRDHVYANHSALNPYDNC